MKDDNLSENIVPSLAPEPPRKRKWLKVLLIILAIPFFLFFLRGVLYSLLSYAFPDSPVPDDSHLLLQTLNIPKEDNAFYDLELASSSLPFDSTGKLDRFVIPLLSVDKLDSEKTSVLLAQYATTAKYFQDASNRKVYQVPAYENPENISVNLMLHPVSSIRQTGRSEVLLSRYLHEMGKHKESTDVAFELIRVGALMESSPHQTIIDYLVGMNIKKMGLDRLSKLMSDDKVAQGIKERIAHDVLLYRDNGTGLASGFKFEYALHKSIFTKSFSQNGQPVNNYLTRPNMTVGYLIGHTDFLLDRIDIPCAEFASTTEKRFFSENSPKWWRITKLLIIPNSLGKLMFDMQNASFDKLFQKRCEEEAMIDQLSRLPY